MKSIKTTLRKLPLIIGLLIAIRSNAIDLSLDVLFVAQQANAPTDQFTLHLQEHYDAVGSFRSGLAFIENTGSANLFATELYGSYLSISAQRSATREIDPFDGGAQTSVFSGYNHIEPVFPPQSVTDAIGPVFTYSLLSGPGIAPGYLFEFFWGSGSAIHVIDEFDSGALKFGLKTAEDEFTYIAAVPDSTDTFGLLAMASVLIVGIRIWQRQAA